MNKKVKYRTIEELYDACKTGDVDESKLSIILDNDYTGFYIRSDDGDEEDTVCNGNGDYDVMQMYILLFPKAMVDRC